MSSILLVAPADVSEQLLKSLLLGVILVYGSILRQINVLLFTDALWLVRLLWDLLLDVILSATLISTRSVLRCILSLVNWTARRLVWSRACILLVKSWGGGLAGRNLTCRVIREDSLVTGNHWRLCRVAIRAYLLGLSSVLLAMPDFSLLFLTQIVDRLDKVRAWWLLGENSRLDRVAPSRSAHCTSSLRWRIVKGIE